MIPALARWNGDHAMTKDTTKEAAVAAEALLLDDWFDAIEDGVRARAARLYRDDAGGGTFRGVVASALWSAQARGGRGGTVGCRRAPRASRADADGHVWQDADRRTARSVDRRGRQDARMAERFAARLPAPHPGRRRLDRRGLSRRDQPPPRATRVGRGVCRAGRQGRGQPRLAQDEGRLGRLECAFARRRADRAADPRRHSRACPARQKGDLDLVARGAWRARRRSEDAARDQEHGRGRRGGLACAARRSRPAWIANAGAGRHRRRAGPRKGGGGAMARHGCPTLHRAQASQSPRPRARAPARGNLERLPRHDLRRDATRGEVEHRRKAFFRKWPLKCRAVADSLEEAAARLFTFTRFPPSQWKSIRTSNAIERLHEEFKRRIKTQTGLPCAETAAMLFWALLASGQITMRKVDGWQTLAEKPDDQIIDLAA